MGDKEIFAELLQDMLEQAKKEGNQISQQKLQEYFEDLRLDKEQMNHIYSYLVAHRITVKGFVPSTELKKESKLSRQSFSDFSEDEVEPDSLLMRMYLRELHGKEKLTRQQEQKMAAELVERMGQVTRQKERQEDAVFYEMAQQKEANRRAEELSLLRERFIHHKLHDVVSRARNYALGGETLDELVQEGNLGLLTAMEHLAQFTTGEAFLDYVEKEIQKAMQDYINRTYAADSEEQAMVAKVNFISEAAKALKEENGQEPTLAEMAAYTNLSKEELLAIINLSADNLKA